MRYSHTAWYSFSVEVRESGRSERVHRSYVDFDELPALIKGLDYLSRVEKTATAQKKRGRPKGSRAK